MDKKKLYRSQSDRKLAGVFGGLANYFGIDATLLRLIGLLLLIPSFGTMVLLYICAVFVMPDEKGGTSV
ncbi:PspC domain-containing protein [Paenalkalicoccus suaedae]|uniref:PspC domain-containing protein n=1 Tax=Paenalkalicoccus suaedae TaxID=2592382 RepID=A0A859FFY6_9BACI|nr:PspC domain-containing protein [Paenalkalicoccus suaedae]QKS72273.1 PspC domain-containing protein [Paenalkalicoccus suaedae]